MSELLFCEQERRVRCKIHLFECQPYWIIGRDGTQHSHPVEKQLTPGLL